MYPSDIRYTFGNLNVFFDSPTKECVYDAPQSVSGAADAGEWGEDVYYSVIRYKKEKVTRALLGDSHVRSVVIATEKILHGLQRLRHVISFSPPKSVSIEETLNDFHYNENWNEIKHNVRIEQFVEGTMINIFYTGRKWEISTKSIFSAETAFYSTKTFKDMFYEILPHHMLTHLFDPTLSYSVVMQHTDNRIVGPIFKRNLVIVGVYRVRQDDEKMDVDQEEIQQKVSLIDVINMNAYRRDKEVEGTVFSQYFSFPIRYNTDEFQSYQSLINTFASPTGSTPYNVMGITLYNPATGKRSKIRNPSYEAVKYLRGETPGGPQTQYFSLLSRGVVDEFLRFFPEYYNQFAEYSSDYAKKVQFISQCYLKCFVFKQKAHKSFENVLLKQILFNVHSLYLNKYVVKVTPHAIERFLTTNMTPYQLINFQLAE